jgi:hypothetical protein
MKAAGEAQLIDLKQRFPDPPPPPEPPPPLPEDEPLPELATLVPAPADGSLPRVPQAGPAERLMEMQWSERRSPPTPQPAMQPQPVRPPVPLPFFVPAERPAALPPPALERPSTAVPSIERPAARGVEPVTVARLPSLPEVPVRSSEDEGDEQPHS